MLVLAAMATELRPLVRALELRPRPVGGVDARCGQIAGGRAAVAAVVGVGPSAAGRTAGRLLDAVEVERVLVIGVSGGIDPSLPVGSLISPDSVVERDTGATWFPSRPVPGGRGGTLATTATFAADDASVAALVAGGVAAVDMETAAIAAACERRGVAWGVVRAISDRPDDHLVDETVLGLVREDGSTDGRAVARLLARRPWEVRRLARVARDTRTALDALTRAALADLSGSGS